MVDDTVGNKRIREETEIQRRKMEEMLEMQNPIGRAKTPGRASDTGSSRVDYQRRNSTADLGKARVPASRATPKAAGTAAQTDLRRPQAEHRR